ncbi:MULTISPECIES: DUF3501 family protein [Ferrimonas]|uniref:DUF3501 family protein n=1 Tax=Ferrimonas TaxID=44011 RepID=UPI0004239EEA|nr:MULTISPECIES: DUF3501 family protein [Ferrimonas]USD36578.1 DUF3501 family protein [Ferrimonas sp. SCSIO 43195]
MSKLTRDQLWSLETYAEKRPLFRRQIMEHKRLRQLQLGEHIRLSFEDALTIRYQIQEMLRIEGIFERAGIQEELDAYNPLIPDGTNLKATMLIEYTNVDERKLRLAQLAGIEHTLWLQVGDGQRIMAIADEDMARSEADKTSSVHFLRFEFPPEAIIDIKQGASLHCGIDHPLAGVAKITAPPEVRNALARDLEMHYAS